MRDAWGKGYAIESATAAIDWAFDNLGWTEVVHTIAAENVNSQAVAKRLGSTILRDGWLPAPINSATVVWGQSRAQWMARRRDAGPRHFGRNRNVGRPRHGRLAVRTHPPAPQHPPHADNQQ